MGRATVTVREALTSARAELAAAGSSTDTPHLDAEVLLRHVLGGSRETLYTYPERHLTEPQVCTLRRLVRRRCAGEPVAYLLGSKEFMGLDLAVDRRVLIPRPETETLVERVVSRLPGTGAGRRIVDVGTGSGAVAIAVASLRPDATIIAVDSSAAALAVARANVRRTLGTGERHRRVQLVRGHLLEALTGPFDVIAANLPYIRSDQMTELPVSVQAYEPWTALDGGPDGLSVYRALLAQVPERLAPRGAVLMEADPRQTAHLAALAAAALAGAQIAIVRDLAGHERVVEAAL